MNFLFKTIFGVLIWLLAASAQANPVFPLTLSVIPNQSSVNIGSPLSVDVVINSIDNFDFTLGGFDIDLAYDTSVLELTGISFGSALGDESLLESVTDSSASTSGTANLTELSFLEASASDCVFCLAPYLQDLQGNSFILVSLTFDSIGTGNSGFDLNINVLSDGYANPLDANKNVNQAQITSVPLPAAIWLFASMLPLIGWKRKTVI